MATDGQTRPRLSPETSNPSSVGKCSLCRQTPKAGAVCLNWACTDLCGGRSAMTVPTAISSSFDASCDNSSALSRQTTDAGERTLRGNVSLHEKRTGEQKDFRFLANTKQPQRSKIHR